MTKFISTIVLLLAVTACNAQTTATNWTATDCNSVSHTLFTELDAGKIIVFTWVMPCISCKNGAKAAYDAVQSFSTSHPGRVLSYLADDLGDASCTTLSGWVTSNSIGATSNMTIFSNAGNVIDENDFGGTGMPHVVVMGGADHHIYYNQKNSLTNDLTGITNAINSALATTGASELLSKEQFAVSPNPATNVLRISSPKPIIEIAITTVAGQLISNQVFEKGTTNASVGVATLAPGLYLVKVVDAEGKSSIQKFVKQ
jgi:hypothetical protein